MSIIIVYISGKYTSPYRREQREYIKLACEAALFMMKMGHTPIIPHTMYDHKVLLNEMGYEDFMRCDLELLTKSDCIFMLENYKQSPGALRELEFAKSLGMPVLYCRMDNPASFVEE